MDCRTTFPAFQAENSLLNSPSRQTQPPPECSANSSVSRASFRNVSTAASADHGTIGAGERRSRDRLVVAFAATEIFRERFGNILRRGGRLAHEKRRKSSFAEIGRDGILTGDPLDRAGGRVNQAVAGRFAALSAYACIPIDRRHQQRACATNQVRHRSPAFAACEGNLDANTCRASRTATIDFAVVARIRDTVRRCELAPRTRRG